MPTNPLPRKFADNPRKSLFYLSVVFSCIFGQISSPAATRHVVPKGGVTIGDGSEAAPWTLQHALTNAKAGDVVLVRDRGKDGVVTAYKGRYVVNTSGTTAAPILLTTPPDHKPVLDGTGTVPRGDGDYVGLLHFQNRSNWRVSGLELKNFTTTNTNTVLGVAILGVCQNITLERCKIHHITATLRGAEPGNANGIGVYGFSGTTPTSNIVIDSCEIYSLATGSSESVTFNGNVQGFAFTNNLVHTCNNIGVDVIGWERTAPANDQARQGVIRGNEVHHVDSRKNPVYNGYGAAAGIYVDGGKDVVIEGNRVHACNFGIEVASEARGRQASGIIVRNNLVMQNLSHGILLGGSSATNGGTSNVQVINNTIYKNTGGGIVFQNHATGTVIRNNILWAGASQSFIQHYATTGSNNSVDYNVYFSDAEAAKKGSSKWSWQGKARTGIVAWRAATGNDKNSSLANPQFSSTTTTAAAASANTAAAPAVATTTVPSFQLTAASVAINAGDPALVLAANLTDMGGEPRVMGGRVDIGADEFQPVNVLIRTTGNLNTYEYEQVGTTFAVSRTGDTKSPLTVNLTYSGTASLGADYTAPSTVIIPAGASEATVNIAPIRDKLAEGSETVLPALAAGGNYQASGTSSLFFRIQDVPIDSWRFLTFGANANNAAVSAYQADPDGDGMVNVTEYALGANPLISDNHLLPQPTVENGYLTMRVKRRASAKDVEICPEVSSKLAGPWLSGSSFVTIVEESLFTFRAVDKVPIARALQRYMRLRVCLL